MNTFALNNTSATYTKQKLQKYTNQQGTKKDYPP